MLKYYHAVRDVARLIGEAVDGSVEALREKRVEHEPAMTDRMLGAIEHSLRGYRNKGLIWTAKTLTDRGRNSQESIYGADFMVALNVKLKEFYISKGFLAQAKMIRGDSVGNLEELKEQCHKMILRSPASFVFIYSENGVRVVPAISVLGSEVSPLELYDRSAQRFFEEHLECFIGDSRISSSSPEVLAEISQEFSVRNAIYLGAIDEKFG